jgi:transposase-like protein
MEMGRYLVEAHLVEGRSVGELAKAHGVHRSWIYKQLARYRAEGEAGLAPRSRRPKTSPTKISDLWVPKTSSGAATRDDVPERTSILAERVGAENLIRRTDQGRCTRKKRRYLPSDLRPAFGSTCGETRSRWRPRNTGQQSNWGFRHPQVRAIAAQGSVR